MHAFPLPGQFGFQARPIHMSELVEPAPEHCPGPASATAGSSDACAGCPNQQICKTAPKGPDPGMYSSVCLFLYLSTFFYPIPSVPIESTSFTKLRRNGIEARLLWPPLSTTRLQTSSHPCYHIIHTYI